MTPDQSCHPSAVPLSSVRLRGQCDAHDVPSADESGLSHWSPPADRIRYANQYIPSCDSAPSGMKCSDLPGFCLLHQWLLPSGSVSPASSVAKATELAGRMTSAVSVPEGPCVRIDLPIPPPPSLRRSANSRFGLPASTTVRFLFAPPFSSSADARAVQLRRLRCDPERRARLPWDDAWNRGCFWNYRPCVRHVGDPGVSGTLPMRMPCGTLDTESAERILADGEYKPWWPRFANRDAFVFGSWC